jgi:hypothetical protein
MITLRGRLMASGFGAMTALMLCACAVTGVGVEGSVGYDSGYYEPYGYDYGGWGGGYLVGPGRCCDHRDDHRDDHRGNDRRGDDHRDRPAGGGPGRAAPKPAYRPAPVGRAAPSIPGRSRTH